MNPKYDVIIIGGGLSGLVSAYIAQNFGYTPLIIEKSAHFGGGNRSIKLPTGEIFDSGHHALDSSRSLITTNFFKSVLDQEVLEHELKRGIVLKDNILKYNSPASSWPEDLKTLFDNYDFNDDIEKISSIAQIERVYGERFLRFIIDDVLKSYPSKAWALKKGGALEEHIDFVYPWFFPYAKKVVSRENEWEAFHDKKREEKHFILYPEKGGFENFITKLVEKIEFNPHIFIKAPKDLSFNLKEGTFNLESITANGTEFFAQHIFWCAPITSFFQLLNKSISIEGVPQKIVLGNFVLTREIDFDFHELLVGSSSHLINRISFPGFIRGEKNNLIQVEFYHPEGEYDFTKEEWFERWFNSLSKLSIIDSIDVVKDFQLVEQTRGLATIAPFEEVSKKLTTMFNSIETNVKMPFPMVGPENINRLVPETIFNVTKTLVGKR